MSTIRYPMEGPHSIIASDLLLTAQKCEKGAYFINS